MSEVLEELGEKPQVETERVGKLRQPLRSTRSAATDYSGARPVKVSFKSGVMAGQILTMSRNLKQSQRFSKLFISPDRTLEQRQQHREVVTELREKLKADCDRRHFIRGGRVHSEEKESQGSYTAVGHRKIIC